MSHGNKMTYVMLGIGVVALALAFKVNIGFLIFLLVCPLMMFMMMRSMGSGGGMDGMHGGEDHTGHGCEHDPTRHDHTTEPRS